MNVNFPNVLTAQLLKNKRLPEIRKVLSLSFEYMLASIAATKYDTVHEFRTKYQESFKLPAILVNPFFVAVSNGHAESLYNLFGEFFTFSFGPGSSSLHYLIESNRSNPEPDILTFFSIDNTKAPLIIEVTDKSMSNRFDTIRQEILDYMITINGTLIAFKDILILSDAGAPDPIYQAIDEGITIIKNQSINNRTSIFDGDKELILFRAMYIPKFQEGNRSNQILEIKYEDIQKAPHKPFPKEKRQEALSLV